MTAGALVAVAQSGAAAGPARVTGTGDATASVANLTEAAGYPEVGPAPAVTERFSRYLRDNPAESARLSGATSATGPAPAPDAVAPVAKAAVSSAPSVNRSFDGITQNQGTGCAGGSGCRPSVNAASSATQIVELVNTFIQVHTRSGGLVCGGITLNRLFRTSDLLLDPKIQFDMVNRRFSLLVTVFPASGTSPPAMWVAASDTENGCGTYRIYRLFFPNTPAFRPGIWPTFASLGQDTRALLISTRSQDVNTGFKAYSVFGLPKSTVYSGGQLSFPVFAVESDVAAVTNAGQPMVSSPFSYFIGSVRDVGYLLYRLSNSGAPGATLTLQATVSAPFTTGRGASQPGTNSGLTPTFGEITSSPFFDGRRVWFTHEVLALSSPTVRYGFVDTVTNEVSFAFVKRSTPVTTSSRRSRSG